MKNIIFWGATGQAKVLKECIKDFDYKLIALFDNNLKINSPFDDVPLFYGQEGFENWLANNKNSDKISFMVAIGGDKGKIRLSIQNYLKEKGLIPLSVVHKTAYISDESFIDEGSQILAKSFIGVGVNIGKSCIINTGSIVDHECKIGDGVHIAPGVHLAGCVEIENYSTVYTGATICPRVRIGEGSVVGAGAVVIKDVPPYSMVVGNPSRIIRKIENE